MATHVVLSGSDRPKQRDAVRVRDVDPGTSIEVTVTLRGGHSPDVKAGESISREELERTYTASAQAEGRGGISGDPEHAPERLGRPDGGGLSRRPRSLPLRGAGRVPGPGGEPGGSDTACRNCDWGLRPRSAPRCSQAAGHPPRRRCRSRGGPGACARRPRAAVQLPAGSGRAPGRRDRRVSGAHTSRTISPPSAPSRGARSPTSARSGLGSAS
jgi:hypothetical protein